MTHTETHTDQITLEALAKDMREVKGCMNDLKTIVRGPSNADRPSGLVGQVGRLTWQMNVIIFLAGSGAVSAMGIFLLSIFNTVMQSQ